MGGGVITPPYNGWYKTYKFKFDDQLIKADNLNNNLSAWFDGLEYFVGFGVDRRGLMC